MLWDLVRDFFVMYIFGGYASNGSIYSGYMFYSEDIGDFLFNTDAFYFLPHLNDWYGGHVSFCLGDYLSLIATIITMIIIVICCAKLVLYIFNTMRRIIS